MTAKELLDDALRHAAARTHGKRGFWGNVFSGDVMNTAVSDVYQLPSFGDDDDPVYDFVTGEYNFMIDYDSIE